MQRMTAAVMFALTSCIFVTDDRAPAPPPPSAFTIVLRVAEPSLLNDSDCIVTVRIGADETSAPAAEQRGGTSLTQYFASLRETARDALFKRLRMA